MKGDWHLRGAGRCAVVFIDDGDGGRIVVVNRGDLVLSKPVVVAISQGQVDQVIAALTSLREGLPPGFIEEKA